MARVHQRRDPSVIRLSRDLVELARSPWNARDALDVIAILDTPAWAALLGLIDPFPTLHAAVGASLAGTADRIEAAAFEFISGNGHVRRAHDFMQSLPALLSD